MTTKLEHIKEVTVTEGDRYLTLRFIGVECIKCDSNLPYTKDVSDWKFYSRAIATALKKL